MSTVAPNERNRCAHVVTGKPIESGGSQGRDKATGQGVVFLIERWASEHNNGGFKGVTRYDGGGNQTHTYCEVNWILKTESPSHIPHLKIPCGHGVDKSTKNDSI